MLIYLFFAIGCLLLMKWLARVPFVGLLLMLAVNPAEALFKLPGSLSVGRLVGAAAVAGWLINLRGSGTGNRLKEAKLRKLVWVFPAVCILGVLLTQGGMGGRGFSSAITIVLLALMSLMIEDLANTSKKWNQLFLVVALTSSIEAIFALAIYNGIDLYSPLGLNAASAVDHGRTIGLGTDANALGVATSMGLFALIIFGSTQPDMSRGLFYWVSAVGLLGGLMLSGSRTHLLAFSVFTFAFGGLRLLGPQKARWRAAGGILGVLMLLGFAYSRAPTDLQERFILVGGHVREDTRSRSDFAWHQREQAVDILSKHPLFGLGLRGYSTMGSKVEVHDTFSAVVGETGLTGALAISWLVVSCGRWLRSGYRRGLAGGDMELYNFTAGFMASMVAMLFAGLGGYVIFYQRWFWITVGASAVTARWLDARDRAGFLRCRAARAVCDWQPNEKGRM